MRPIKSTPTLTIRKQFLVYSAATVVLCTGIESTHAEEPSVPTGVKVTKGPGKPSVQPATTPKNTQLSPKPSAVVEQTKPKPSPLSQQGTTLVPPVGIDTQKASAPSKSVADSTKPKPSPLSAQETTPLPACKGSNDAFEVRFDARSGQLILPSHHTYAGKSVEVCIQNPDYRMSYTVTTTEVPLVKTGGESLLEMLFPKKVSPENARAEPSNAVSLALLKDKSDFAEQVTHCQNATLSTAQRLLGVLEYLSPSNAGAVEQLNPSLVADNLKMKVDDALKACDPFISDGAKKAEAALTAQIEKEVKNDADRNILHDAVSELSKEGMAQAGLLATLQAIEAQIATHLAPFNRPISIATRGNTEVEIVVQAKPLKVSGLQLNQSNDSNPKAVTLSYGAATTLARTKLEVRSLSYVRVAVGLGFTSLRNDTVSEQRDAQGQAVLRTGHDAGIAGMILLSHYWYGVDERETQPWSSPWDSSRSPNRLVNLIPSIAIGLPLTQQNTLQNFFFGLLFQPIPAVGMVFGGHVGRINQLRPEFSDGMTLPSKETGFRIEGDTLAPVTKMGWFLGVMVTDSIFAKLIRDSLSK